MDENQRETLTIRFVMYVSPARGFDERHKKPFGAGRWPLAASCCSSRDNANLSPCFRYRIRGLFKVGAGVGRHDRAAETTRTGRDGRRTNPLDINSGIQ